jgi:AcrR family transcriptional regulator
MARRSDHTREEIRELILDESWKIIGSEGFEGLTARGIAGRIGYAPGTIYNIFNSMDDLALHTNARTLDLLFDVLSDPASGAAGVPTEGLKILARRYMAFTKEYRPYWLMLFNREVPEGRKDLEWYQEKIDRLFAPLEDLLARYFGPRDKRKAVAARVLWASVHGLCILQGTGKIPVVKDGGSVPDMADYLIDTFVKGIDRK